MKIVITTFTFTILLGIFSCKKSPNFTSSMPLGISAKINNVPWLATGYSVQKSVATVGGSQILLRIKGYDSLYINSVNVERGIILSIDDLTNKTGTYSVTNTSNTSYYYAYPVWADASIGVITLTKISSNNIQGTFSFTGSYGTTVYSITDGQFNLNLQ
jgi:hypothetical protein